jgi:hypothetical protein
MDNFSIDIGTRSRRDLVSVMQIMLGQHRRATHFRVEEREGKPARLILFWTDSKTAEPFPYPLDTPETAADSILSWLQDIEYPENDFNDSDITEEKGFRAYNEAWGHVANDPYAFLAIEPRWCWYGK